jgi:multidrug efflux pump subunit AcrA (membrane-fusion protein)
MANRTPILVDVFRLVLPFAVLGLGFWGMMALGEAEKPPVNENQGRSSTIVETAAIVEHDGEFDIVVDGAVVPYRQVDVSAEVDGRIVAKNPDCRAGRYVTPGMELFTIDTREYELEVSRLEQQLAQQDASIAETEVEIENNDASVALADEEVQSLQAEVARYEGLLANGRRCTIRDYCWRP